jgi:hypothetical protein
MPKTDAPDPTPETTPEAMPDHLAVPAVPAVPEPAAGGNYLRDPVTGVITHNPAHKRAPE